MVGKTVFHAESRFSHIRADCTVLEVEDDFWKKIF